MAILHGSWISSSDQALAESTPDSYTDDRDGGYFLIWGEIWRRVEPIAAESNAVAAPAIHPFVMTVDELLELLRSKHQSQQLQWSVADVPIDAPIAADSRGHNRRAKSSHSTKTAISLPPDRWQTVSLMLPTYQLPTPSTQTIALLPQHSAAQGQLDLETSILESSIAASESDHPHHSLSLSLCPWQIQGLRLTVTEALQVLQSLPLSSVQGEEFSWLGSDLRFWSHVARWQLDLLARAKFLPTLEQHAAMQVRWHVLIDSSVDQDRLEHFTRQMPSVCRAYVLSGATQFEAKNEIETAANGVHPSTHPATAVLSPAPPILLSFLNQAIDAQVRAVASSQAMPSSASFPKDIALREWLQALGDKPTIDSEPAKLERLVTSLTSWTAPLQHQLNQRLNAFRTCFYLHPPTAGQQDWTLEYFLQAANDPDFLVSARTVWNNPVERLDYMGRTIDQPQETLLAGLGLASRLYPVLEPSLQVSQPHACQLHPLQVYEFIKTTAWRLQDSGFGVILPPSLSNQEGWANRLGLRVQAETPKAGKNQRLGLQSLLNFKWELTIGGQRLSKAEFDRLVALNTPLVEINGEWVELRPQDVRAAQAFFESRKEQMSLSLEDALRISTGDAQMIEKLPVVGFEASGPLEELINALTNGNQSIESIPIPKGFQGTLRPYQVRGASWLAFLERWGLGACLADDMGLGKTVQFIALMLHLQEQGGLEKPTLLVCPTSVLGNWEREVKRFAPSLKTLVHHGDKRSQGKAFVKAIKDKHLVITSYALVQRDVKDLQTVTWQGVVLDEAQNVKNPDAKQSQAIRQLDCQFRIALTGTPVENRLAELWSIMDFLNPGYLGPRNFFQRRFAVPIERYGDTASLQTLRSLVQPFILRRLKTDRSIIQDLPEKQEMTVFCGLTQDQAALYQTLVERSLVEIESADGIQRKGMILALLTKLKQVCNHPVLFKEESREQKEEKAKGKRQKDKEDDLDSTLSLEPLAFRLASGKLQRLEEMLEEVLAEGDRSLIFTQFAEWGKLLQAYLAQRFERDVLFLYGGSSKKQREEMVDRFQNDPQGPRLFILSLKAGGVGLNLTRANHVFHFDRWWNPAVENQATDRVFRIGQTRNVQVHKFVCTGTLEERIHELIESKKALSEQVVGTGENWLSELDTDALRNLLLLDRAAVIDEEDE
ncbi:DEAD/DEAH box helicase [Thermocoleostomius sinensis A174]|uniref:DEAD/DEAH box helicase n=2 Tax=Thermocoleostomius TaxID=3065395 RepID=A0A9E9C6L7_9CYAN|nr:DEAD/DEAH box helicase [Thermocoleostomius sinensis]WAL58338.1 DEAD/DEAH box helicase [Thermocoleostomius sinensis A174]